MFVVQAHDLLKGKDPGAWVKFGKVTVPVIMYAGDVNLVVMGDAKQMQELLKVLHAFSDLLLDGRN